MDEQTRKQIEAQLAQYEQARHTLTLQLAEINGAVMALQALLRTGEPAPEAGDLTRARV